MKPVFLIFLSLLLTGCLKASVAPVTPQNNALSFKSDTASTKATTLQSNTTPTYDWYNGTTGTALIQVTCNDCNAIATIGNETIPFLFNEQGVGQLKYTPAVGLVITIAVCPGATKAIKTQILDAADTPLYTYAGISGNWNTTFVIK